MANELMIETRDPELLERTLNGLPAVTARVVPDSYDGTACLVSISGDVGFVRYAIEQQGYGRVIAPGSGA